MIKIKVSRRKVAARMTAQKKPKNFRQGKAFRTLKQAMLDNLAARGLDREAYADKVEEYMDFWVLRQELKEDIARRGLTVTDDRGRQTENRSVSLSVQVSRQMMALFTTLGFKVSDFMGTGGDDEL